jgi:hypothetical protein
MEIIETDIDYWKWTELYKPIPNHFEKTAAIDGCLFLPTGKQWEFVRQHDDNNIWSLIVTDLENCDDTLWEIMTGVHYVNRQGYLVTEVPYPDDMSIIY